MRRMLRVALSTILLCALALCTDANEVVTSRCTAEWNFVGTFRNPSREPTLKKIDYQVGTHFLKQSRNTLQSVLVIVQNETNYRTNFRTTKFDIRSSTAKQDYVNVTAKSTLHVWQLVARTSDEVVNFGKIVLIEGMETPLAIVSCRATHKLPQRITDYTWVQLKHERTKMYLTTTNRKGWDAGTLKSYKNNRFRFEHLGSGIYRIVAESVRFPGYNYLYSSIAGGIYLDQSDTSEKKQLWTLSTSDLRDGDSITIQNVYYSGGYMIKYDGGTTNVYCEYTHYPDRWIVEVA